MRKRPTTYGSMTTRAPNIRIVGFRSNDRRNQGHARSYVQVAITARKTARKPYAHASCHRNEHEQYNDEQRASPRHDRAILLNDRGGSPSESGGGSQIKRRAEGLQCVLSEVRCEAKPATSFSIYISQAFNSGSTSKANRRNPMIFSMIMISPGSELVQ